MTVAIIIPTLDPDSEMLAQCCEAIRATLSVAPEHDLPVVIQHDSDREGFARTCNLAAKETDADTLVFLNDDTIPQPDWLQPLTEALQGTRNDVPTPCIAGSHLVYPNGSSQHTGAFLRRGARGELEAYNRRRPAPSGEVPAVTGACLAIGRDLWEELGGFDEGYRNGYEDIDLCLRARRDHNAQVRYVAESVVVHLESQSPGRFDHAPENIALLNERWGSLPI